MGRLAVRHKLSWTSTDGMKFCVVPPCSKGLQRCVFVVLLSSKQLKLLAFNRYFNLRTESTKFTFG